MIHERHLRGHLATFVYILVVSKKQSFWSILWAANPFWNWQSSSAFPLKCSFLRYCRFPSFDSICINQSTSLVTAKHILLPNDLKFHLSSLFYVYFLSCLLGNKYSCSKRNITDYELAIILRNKNTEFFLPRKKWNVVVIFWRHKTTWHPLFFVSRLRDAKDEIRFLGSYRIAISVLLAFIFKNRRRQTSERLWNKYRICFNSVRQNRTRMT